MDEAIAHFSVRFEHFRADLNLGDVKEPWHLWEPHIQAWESLNIHRQERRKYVDGPALPSGWQGYVDSHFLERHYWACKRLVYRNMEREAKARLVEAMVGDNKKWLDRMREWYQTTYGHEKHPADLVMRDLGVMRTGDESQFIPRPRWEGQACIWCRKQPKAQVHEVDICEKCWKRITPGSGATSVREYIEGLQREFAYCTAPALQVGTRMTKHLLKRAYGEAMRMRAERDAKTGRLAADRRCDQCSTLLGGEYAPLMSDKYPGRIWCSMKCSMTGSAEHMRERHCEDDRPFEHGKRVKDDYPLDGHDGLSPENGVAESGSVKFEVSKASSMTNRSVRGKKRSRSLSEDSASSSSRREPSQDRAALVLRSLASQ